MWYLVWIFGVLFACALSVLTLLWLEQCEFFEQEEITPDKQG